MECKPSTQTVVLPQLRHMFLVPRARSFVTVVISTLALILACLLFAPSSVTWGALSGSLPFAAIIAIVGLGQLLVVQQGGFDLSLAGGVSLAVVISTHYPQGDNALLLPAVLMAIACAILAGLANGILVSLFRLNAIVATIGVNALLYGAVFAVSGGVPKTTTTLLAAIAGGQSIRASKHRLFRAGRDAGGFIRLEKDLWPEGASKRSAPIHWLPAPWDFACSFINSWPMSMPSSSIAWLACLWPASPVNPQHSKATPCSCLPSPSSFSAERRCLVVVVFRSRPSSPRSS